MRCRSFSITQGTWWHPWERFREDVQGLSGISEFPHSQDLVHFPKYIVFSTLCHVSLCLETRFWIKMHWVWERCNFFHWLPTACCGQAGRCHSSANSLENDKKISFQPLLLRALKERERKQTRGIHLNLYELIGKNKGRWMVPGGNEKGGGHRKLSQLCQSL